MANFLEAYAITRDHEGGYTFDPDDVGGETYKGIARRYSKSWTGWVIIDGYKSNSNFPAILYEDKELNAKVTKFFKDRYWDVNLLDEFPSQNIANEMFDTGVNMGVDRAAKFLQIALNVLNKKGTIYSDIVVDGKIGPATLRALNACINYRGEVYLYKVLNILQGYHYIEYMQKSETQEKFAYGWLNRVDFIKK